MNDSDKTMKTAEGAEAERGVGADTGSSSETSVPLLESNPSSSPCKWPLRGAAGFLRVVLFALSVVVPLRLPGAEPPPPDGIAQRIEQALAFDAETGERFMADGGPDAEHPTAGHVYLKHSRNRKQYCGAMRSYLYAADVPDDFKSLFLDHVEAHSKLALAEEKAAWMIAESTNKGGTYDASETRRVMESLAEAINKVDETFDLVNRCAIKYGAKVPDPPVAPEKKTGGKEEAGSPQSAQELTQDEKLAIGRVVIAMRKLTDGAASTNSSGDLSEEWFGGLGSAVLWKNVNTEGCPERFVDAWKDFAQSAAAVMAYKAILALFAASLDEKNGQGRPINSESAAKLAEIVKNGERLANESSEKRDVFLSLLQSYGTENLGQWEKDAAKRFKNNEDLFLLSK